MRIATKMKWNWRRSCHPPESGYTHEPTTHTSSFTRLPWKRRKKAMPDGDIARARITKHKFGIADKLRKAAIRYLVSFGQVKKVGNAHTMDATIKFNASCHSDAQYHLCRPLRLSLQCDNQCECVRQSDQFAITWGSERGLFTPEWNVIKQKPKPRNGTVIG